MMHIASDAAADLAPGDDGTAAGAGRRPPSRPRRWRSWREPLLRLLMAVAPISMSGALWVLRWTTRIRFANLDELFGCWQRGEQVIVAFWHDRVVMMPIAYRGRRLCIMNSQHRDGEIATRALARWGIRSVRGSATRGGARGFLQLVRAYRGGDDLAVVPDGPRGPRHVVKAGVIHLARVTGAPIYPVSYSASRKRNLHSWDRLLVPLPLARVLFVGGAPLRVDRDASDDEVEGLRVELEKRLQALTDAADAQVGV